MINENLKQYEYEKDLLNSIYDKAIYYIPGKAITISDNNKYKFMFIGEKEYFNINEMIQTKHLYPLETLTKDEKQKIEYLKNLNQETSKHNIQAIETYIDNKVEYVIFSHTETNTYYKLDKNSLIENLENISEEIIYYKQKRKFDNPYNINYSNYAAKKLEAEKANIYLDTVTYINYIATRPSVEKDKKANHGLFNLNGVADLQENIDMAKKYKKHIKWSYVISLERNDAVETGFNKAIAWRNLLNAKVNSICKAYNISLENLVLNFSYHDKDHHPHIHLFFYSKDRKEGFIKGNQDGLKKATRKLKSMFFNEIFKDDVSYLKIQKTDIREEMKNTLQQKLINLTKEKIIDNTLENMLLELAKDIKENHKGKLVYEFLNKELKEKVNDILKYIVNINKTVNEIYNSYLDTQKEFISFYVDEKETKERELNKFKEKFFSPGKNDNKIFHNVILKYISYIEKECIYKTKNRPQTIQEKNFDEHENLSNNEIIKYNSYKKKERMYEDEKDAPNYTEKNFNEHQKSKRYTAKKHANNISYSAKLLITEIARILIDLSYENKIYQNQNNNKAKNKSKFKKKKKTKIHNYSNDISY